MAIRPMRPDERAYLEEYKASLEDALRGAWLTAGLWCLPIGFLASGVLTALHGSGDRLAIGLAGTFLFALVGSMLGLSPQAARGRKLRLSDLRLPGLIEEDLLRDEVEEDLFEAGAKLVRGGKRGGQAARRYFVKIGERELELTGLRWMNMSPGQPLELTFAPRAGLALSVGGLRERLPMPGGRKQAANRQPDGDESSPPGYGMSDEDRS